MAYRFKREGIHTCSRPWVDEFKWRATSWHYKFTMGPLAKKALLENQSNNEGVQYILDAVLTGKASSKFPTSTKRFYFRVGLPITTPFISSSNPFCPITPNSTGWEEWRPKRIPDLQPHGKHKVKMVVQKAEDSYIFETRGFIAFSWALMFILVWLHPTFLKLKSYVFVASVASTANKSVGPYLRYYLKEF